MDGELSDGRAYPSEVEIAAALDDTVRAEDKGRILSWVAHGGLTPVVKDVLKATALPATREEMLNFARSDRWKAKSVAADPKAAEGMRRLRARVAELKAEGQAAAAVPGGASIKPNSGLRLLNVPITMQSAKTTTLTSSLNPMNHHVLETGWDPNTRQWPGRRIGDIDAKRDSTSFWCESWGASASNKGLDTNFVYVRRTHPEVLMMPKKSELHSKGWR